MLSARAVFLSLVLAGGSAAASTSIAVDLAPPSSSPSNERWFAAALEQTVAHQLSRFRDVTIADKLDAAACPRRDVRCLVDGYGAAGVQVVVVGKLRRNVLDYEVYATWMRGRAFDGSLAVAGVDAATLRRHIGGIARPIFQRGGLVDQRPASPTAAVVAAPSRAIPLAPAAAARHPLLFAAILVGFALFVAFPPLLLWMLLGGRELRKRGAPASWKWSAALVALCAAVLIGTGVVDVRTLPLDRSLGLAIAAGMLWGTFVLLNASWVLAPLRGLGQARHDAIWPLLQSWLALVLLRASLLVLYAPLLWLALVACAALGLSERVTVALALPAVGLIVYVWLLTLVDNLALYLDSKLVVGRASARNPWHATIKRYFRGYVRRNGVELDATLFERTLFLPSALPAVVSYGGGFARPRILVGEQARDAALGQLPDETELPDHTVNAEEMPLGFVVPGQRPTPAGEQRRHELALAPARARGFAPKLIGENATLLGWVMPQAGDDGIPLISNSVEDYDVVKRLLTEHYAAFERNVDDEEIDDTDPTQKDFLFGALLREMGTLASHDSLLSTIRLAFAARVSFGFYDRFLSGPAARIADAQVALNQGLHHLIQYLSFLRVGTAAPLTTRANAPELIQTSKDLFDHMDRAAIATVERQVLAATPRNRLSVALAPVPRAARPPPRSRAAPHRRAGAGAGRLGRALPRRARRRRLPPDLSRATRSEAPMSDPQSNNPSGFFEVINKSTLAVSKKAAGAGVIGLVGFAAILAVAAVFFITENYFVAMLFISLALLVYATGAEIGKLMLSTMTVFFSSRHLTPKAAQLQQTLAALEETLTLRRDRDGELRVGPVEKGHARAPARQSARARSGDGAGAAEELRVRRVHRLLLLRRVPRALRSLERAPRLRRRRHAAVRPHGHGARAHQHVRQPGRRRHRRGDRAAAGAGAQVHALRRRLLGALQDQRHALRAALEGARLRLRHARPRAQGHLRQRSGDRGPEMRRPQTPRLRRAFDIWQIVYIDLMTNVMIFFVVLWAVQSRPSKSGISDNIGTETVKMVSLPGDVLFSSGKSELSEAGHEVMSKLFSDDTHTVLNFDVGPVAKRMLVIHGHTDNEGAKEKNLDLGYQRALAAYREILKYGSDVPDHVVICTHADNSPAQEVPAFGDTLTPAEQQAVKEAKAKNRRITIEDKLVSRVKEQP